MGGRGFAPQGFGGPMGEGPGRDGGGPQEGPMRGRAGRPPGPPPVSIAQLPTVTLQKELKLTDDQATKIGKIKQRFDEEREDLMPTQPKGGDEHAGRPRPTGDPELVRALDQSASHRMCNLLTDTQRQSLHELLRTVGDLQAAGIPAGTYEDLALTSDQKDKIAAIARSARREMREARGGDFEDMRQAMADLHDEVDAKVKAVLTDAQNSRLAAYKKDHPAPPMGPPPPGFGGPQPGRDQEGFGGPDGGPDGGPGGRGFGGPDGGPGGGPDGGPSGPGFGGPAGGPDGGPGRDGGPGPGGSDGPGPMKDSSSSDNDQGPAPSDGGPSGGPGTDAGPVDDPGQVM